jgi:hypothetical protein
MTLTAFAQKPPEHPAAGAAKFLNGITRYANDRLLSDKVTSEINRNAAEINRQLAADPEKGILYEVAIYKNSEDYKFLQGVLYVGVGTTPVEAAVANLRQGTIGPSAPSGTVFDVDSSYLLWLTKSEQGFKIGTIPGAQRVILWTKAATALNPQ